MKKNANSPLYVLTLIVLISTLFAACGGGPAPEETNSEPTEAPVTEEVQPTEAPTEEPTEAPIVEIAPTTTELKVGNTVLFADGSVLVAVPGGTFIMGNDSENAPTREVDLGGFWIQQTEVTNQMFAFCVQQGICTSPDETNNPGFNKPEKANDPVVGVTHAQAQAYCEFIHGRLPTEAEWEKTARGPEGNIYPWGNDEPACNLSNFGTCVGETSAVDEHPDGKSFYEALDMAGNGFEWVSDWYDPAYYQNAPTENPTGPAEGEQRTVRSGGFNSEPADVASAVRFSEDPENQRNDLGFRCVVEEDQVNSFAPYCESLALLGADKIPGELLTDGIFVPCAPPIVNQTPFCNEFNQPFVNISAQDSPLWDAQIKGDQCIQSGDIYSCPSGGTVEVCNQCSEDAALQIIKPFIDQDGCPNNTTYNPNTGKCDIAGSNSQGTSCLPGFNYDPLTQCCSAAPDSADTITPCPAGTYLAFGIACVDLKVGSSCQNVTLPVLACGTTGGGGSSEGGGDGSSENGGGSGSSEGGGGGSSCSDPGCGGRTTFCASSCSCIPVTASCP